MSEPSSSNSALPSTPPTTPTAPAAQIASTPPPTPPASTVSAPSPAPTNGKATATVVVSVNSSKNDPITSNLLHKFDCTERGNAQLLAHVKHDQIRFDYGSEQWMVRVGEYWKPDSDGAMIRLMWEANDLRRKACMNIPADAPQDRLRVRDEHLAWVRKTNSYRIVEQSLRCASALSDLLIAPDKMDHDPFLLGTKEGVYDLKTGKRATKDRLGKDLYISKLTAVSPAPSADCPLWIDFLMKATRGDLKLIAYLRRLAGYALTGEIREQALIWFIGEGGAGKGTFLETLLDLQGLGPTNYGHSMRVEALVMNKHDVHPTELCDLQGKRLVVTSETDNGRVWKESLLKKLSGGDSITARRVHRDTITFRPTHKLVIMGNFPPQLSAVGEAERRRYQMVPWEVTFKDEEDSTFDVAKDVRRDRTFASRLRAEYPYILRWCMEGCIEWLDQGSLRPPTSVMVSSVDFIGEQDLIKQWLEERCTLDTNSTHPSTEAFEDWKGWCKRQNEFVGTQRSFINSLKAKGFYTREMGLQNVRTIIGLALKPPDLTEKETPNIQIQ